MSTVVLNALTPKHQQYRRLQELGAYYKQQYNEAPSFYVKVPGRVNIIGEHVDYCGYPVLPMALEQCILLAVGVGGSKLHLRNINSVKFDNYECEIRDISVKKTTAGVEPVWYNYFLCGVKGIIETLDDAKCIGMKVAVSGNIPPAAGLSSSSALVSAAVLATAHVHQLCLEAHRLATIAAHSERYIGTEGGGMDQAIAFLAQAGCAQFIEFFPELRASSVKLPANVCFIVANSMVKKNKAASADFNERVVECQLGARILAKVLGLEDWQNYTRFILVQKALSCDLRHLQQLIGDHLPQDIYTRPEVLEMLETSEDEFMRTFLTANTQHMMLFKLNQRALHVIQESMRVLEFRAICEEKDNCLDADVSNERLVVALSKLLRASHQSLQVLYECSHPSLDRLIAISDQVGVCARLTGAGWGGFIVALCINEIEAAEYIRILKTQYYQKVPEHVLTQHEHNNFNDLIFSTVPCSGAEIIISKSEA